MTDREKLIEILRKPIFPHEMVDPIEAVADYLLDNGVTVQKWIPVTERLPEDSTDVLVFGFYHEAFQILICHYRSDFNGEWFRSVAGQQVYDVTHWMPLPSTEGIV